VAYDNLLKLQIPVPIMKKKIVIISNENKTTDKLIRLLDEFEIIIGEKHDSADMHLEVKDDNRVALIKNGKEDLVNLNCKFFNLDNKYYKNGVRIERRDTVAVILRNSTGEIMCLNWNNEKKWKSFVSGGVENGDIVQSAIDEIREETGYVNVKFVREINCETRDRFYAPHKNVNRYLINRAVIFDLVDEEKNDIEEIEIEKHVPIWIKGSEILNFLTVENHKFLFREYLGEKQEYDNISILINEMI